VLHAEPYPSRPIRIIVAYPAGQGTDTATRYLADQVGRDLGQPIVIDNRPGAGGNLGTDMTAKSAPDGYTLTMGTNATHVLNEFLYSNLSYSPANDFEPILMVGTFPMVLAVEQHSPFTTVQQLLAAVKSKPRAADIAMPSTSARLVVELLKETSGAQLFGVPYKGSGAAITDLMGSQLPAIVDTPTSLRPHIAAGKIRPLALTSKQESPLMPGVPTIAEQGFSGFEVIAWNALYAPKGTSKEILGKLNAAFNRALSKPETRQKLLEFGFEPAGGSAETLSAFGKQERTKWQGVISAAGLKVD